MMNTVRVCILFFRGGRSRRGGATGFEPYEEGFDSELTFGLDDRRSAFPSDRCSPQTLLCTGFHVLDTPLLLGDPSALRLIHQAAAFTLEFTRSRETA
jgi:hypothetical protein